MQSEEYKKILKYENPIDRKRRELVERRLMKHEDKSKPVTKPKHVAKVLKPKKVFKKLQTQRHERKMMFNEDPVGKRRVELEEAKKQRRLDKKKNTPHVEEYVKGVPRSQYMREYKRRKRNEKNAFKNILKERELHDHLTHNIFLKDEEPIRKHLAAEEVDLTKAFDGDDMQVDSDNDSLYQMYDEYDKLMEPINNEFWENLDQGADAPKSTRTKQKKSKSKPKTRKL